MQTKYLCVSSHIWMKDEVGLSCVWYAFVHVCLYVLCGHLLGKGWPWLLLCRRTVSLSLSHWFGRGILLYSFLIFAPLLTSIFNFNKIVTDINIDSNTPDSWDCQNANYLYPPAGHVITGNLNVIPDYGVRYIIFKGLKYRFSSNIDFSKCLREIDASLNDSSNRWCKRVNVNPDALREWKGSNFKIIDTCISFYSRNSHVLPPKPRSSFFILKRGTCI